MYIQFLSPKVLSGVSSKLREYESSNEKNIPSGCCNKGKAIVCGGSGICLAVSNISVDHRYTAALWCGDSAVDSMYALGASAILTSSSVAVLDAETTSSDTANMK